MFVQQNLQQKNQKVIQDDVLSNKSQISILKNQSSHINVEVNQSIKTQNPVCIKEENYIPMNSNMDAASLAQIAEKNALLREEIKKQKQERFQETIQQRARMIQKENQIKKKQEQMQKDAIKQRQLNRNKISFEQSSIQSKKISNSGVQITCNKKTNQDNGVFVVKNESNLESTVQEDEENQQVPQPISQDNNNQLESIVEQVNQEESLKPKAQVILPSKNKNGNDEGEDGEEGSEDGEDIDDKDEIFDCETSEETINKYQAMRIHLKNYTVPESYSETYSEYFGEAPQFQQIY